MASLPQAESVVERFPIIGEVPKPVLDTGEPFWLGADQSSVPEQYRHDTFPAHYGNLPTLHAAWREDAGFRKQGSWASHKLRRLGLMPAVLSDLPVSQRPRPLVLPSAQISTAFRHFGASFPNLLCILHIVQLEDLVMFNMKDVDAQAAAERYGLPTPLHTFQVLPRRPSYNRAAGTLQAITLMNAPSNRIVQSHVPIVALNEDESPCSKKGGFALVTKKTVPVRSLVSNVPLQIEIDCGDYDLYRKVFVRDLEMPQGQHIVQVHRDTCVLKMDLGGT